MKMELEVKSRNGKVAPFINYWNVWDLEPEYWVDSVKKAIVHAYELGWLHCRNQIIESKCNLEANYKWPEPEEGK